MDGIDFLLVLASCVAVVLLMVSVIWSICDCKIARYKVEKVLDENKRLKAENKKLKADYSKLQARAKKYIKKGV